MRGEWEMVYRRKRARLGDRVGSSASGLTWVDVAGSAVLSHRVAPAVPSAQRGLTSEFGMGSGGSPAL